MESVTGQPPLIVILGQTASGKSALALQLAQQFDGEIIAADSRTVYRGMDIGTAKPTAAERQRVPHHLIDVVDPDERFTVADFQRLAQAAIVDIGRRNKVAFLVGGSGLYIDSVIYDFRFRGGFDPEQRARYETLDVDALQEELLKQGLELPVNTRNPRHLIRSLEAGGAVPGRQALRINTLVIGLSLEASQLEANIRRRVDQMVEHGFADEVRQLVERYGWNVPAMQAPGYQALRGYLAGEQSLDQAKQLFVQRDRQFAKRQKTWFKRDNHIRWISKPEEAVGFVTTFLNK